MASLNRVILAGNLTRDVEIKNISDELTVGNTSIAINEGYKDKQTTHFIDITLWNHTAKFANTYLGKGSGVLLEGRLQQDRWQDKDSGQNRSKVYVVVDKLESLDKKGEPRAEVPEVAATEGSASIPF
jgi:single-strand DNA-binding protein